MVGDEHALQIPSSLTENHTRVGMSIDGSVSHVVNVKDLLIQAVRNSNLASV